MSGINLHDCEIAGYRIVATQELFNFNREFGSWLPRLDEGDIETLRLHIEDEGIDNPEMTNAFMTPRGAQLAVSFAPCRSAARYFCVFYILEDAGLLVIYNEGEQEDPAYDNFIVHLIVIILKSELLKLA